MTIHDTYGKSDLSLCFSSNKVRDPTVSQPPITQCFIGVVSILDTTKRLQFRYRL